MSVPIPNPPSYTGGVKPMAIAGRMVRERERLIGMSDAERAWRAQWLKDQVLAPDEPVMPKNYYRERYNILRRFYMWPLNQFQNALAKTSLGPDVAWVVRATIGRGILGMCGIFYVWYHFKYTGSDWTSNSSWKVTISRKAMYPNDPGFPNYPKKEAKDFASFGFNDSPI